MGKNLRKYLRRPNFLQHPKITVRARKTPDSQIWQKHSKSSRVYRTSTKSCSKIYRTMSTRDNGWSRNSKKTRQSRRNLRVWKMMRTYKMVGPVLLKQDKTEAVMAVNGRLEFIENEIKRVEKLISDVENKSDAVRSQIIQIQSESQPQGSQPNRGITEKCIFVGVQG